MLFLSCIKGLHLQFCCSVMCYIMIINHLELFTLIQYFPNWKSSTIKKGYYLVTKMDPCWKQGIKPAPRLTEGWRQLLLFRFLFLCFCLLAYYNIIRDRHEHSDSHYTIQKNANLCNILFLFCFYLFIYLPKNNYFALFPFGSM